MPVPGFVQAAGSAAEDRFSFASQPRLYEHVARSNNHLPRALLRDLSCSLAGLDASHTNNLDTFAGGVLAIGAGRGFGPFMDYQLSLLGSTDVTRLLEPDLGHLDHFPAADHRRYVERPVLGWLRGLFAQR